MAVKNDFVCWRVTTKNYINTSVECKFGRIRVGHVWMKVKIIVQRIHGRRQPHIYHGFDSSCSGWSRCRPCRWRHRRRWTGWTSIRRYWLWWTRRTLSLWTNRTRFWCRYFRTLDGCKWHGCKNSEKSVFKTALSKKLCSLFKIKFYLNTKRL